MVILFDTSVLVAGIVASHPQHQQALARLQQMTLFCRPSFEDKTADFQGAFRFK